MVGDWPVPFSSSDGDRPCTGQSAVVTGAGLVTGRSFLPVRFRVLTLVARAVKC